MPVRPAFALSPLIRVDLRFHFLAPAARQIAVLVRTALVRSRIIGSAPGSWWKPSIGGLSDVHRNLVAACEDSLR
jgi:hypothetical protein